MSATRQRRLHSMVLDKCHRIRNVADYAGSLDVDERIVTDLGAACETVAGKFDE